MSGLPGGAARADLHFAPIVEVSPAADVDDDDPATACDEGRAVFTVTVRMGVTNGRYSAAAAAPACDPSDTCRLVVLGQEDADARTAAMAPITLSSVPPTTTTTTSPPGGDPGGGWLVNLLRRLLAALLGGWASRPPAAPSRGQLDGSASRRASSFVVVDQLRMVISWYSGVPTILDILLWVRRALRRSK